MTQLPEMEVIRKDLEKEVAGKRVKDVVVKTPGLLTRQRNRPEFAKALVGQKIESVTRRGTHMLFGLDNDTVFVVRPGTHGMLSRETANDDAGRYTQMVATFTTGGALHYVDPDKDGELFVIGAEEVLSDPQLSPGGIDALADQFTWHHFAGQLNQRAKPLKQLLLDPSFVVGLGDVYSDEILWTAGLSGARSSQKLSSQEVRRLYRAVLEVLHEAVKQGGTAAEGDTDGESDPFEEMENTDYLKVYGKVGAPCGRCRQPIVHSKVVGRLSGYHCPNCQT